MRQQSPILLALQAQPSPGGAPSKAEDRSATFQPVQGGNEMQSGERLLVEAYAAIWVIVFVFLALMFRRQRRLDQRIEALDDALRRVRAGSAKG
ncbi:CcmD family protein [Polyangium aurulentum]|uniref:CcmD family protein n=1 Tax=Polyangium aurulentum TaxID=2567896 RepID=UPI0010AEA624|nr:CcmD family protein [Polyangium aurulentum]UQA55122.1 CcmD family protein [Polyangium aurulentum]